MGGWRSTLLGMEVHIVGLTSTLWGMELHVEPPWEGDDESLFTGSWSHDQDGNHADICKKKPSKSSSPEPVRRFPRNLVCSIGDSSPS